MEGSGGPPYRLLRTGGRKSQRLLPSVSTEAWAGYRLALSEARQPRLAADRSGLSYGAKWDSFRALVSTVDGWKVRSRRARNM